MEITKRKLDFRRSRVPSAGSFPEQRLSNINVLKDVAGNVNKRLFCHKTAERYCGKIKETNKKERYYSRIMTAVGGV